MLYEPIFAALTAAGVRYVVVGGVATVLHGVARLTADLDLAVDLAADNAAAAVRTLSALGLEPLLPVDPADFARVEVRATWVAERNLKVFSMHDPGDPLIQVDLFAEDVVPFDDLLDRAVPTNLGAVTVPIAAIDDLIAMKQLAARPQDVADIDALVRIAASHG